jgi:crooked neck
MKDQGLKEERLLLLEAWRDAEESLRDVGGNAATVQDKMPRKVKMRRMNVGEDGAELGWEEYYDYLFPDDEKKVGSLKILEKAMAWKAAAEAQNKIFETADHIGGDSALGKRKEIEGDDSIDIDDI